MSQNLPTNAKQKPFYTLNKAENFMNDVITVTCRSPKKYRPNYVHLMQEDAMEIFSCIMFGNEYRDNPKIRSEYQMKAKVHMKRLTRLLDRAERVQCISPLEEADLGQKLAELEAMFDGWVGSNKI